MVLMMLSTKIAQMVLLRRKKEDGRTIDKKYLLMKSPESLVQNQNNFIEMVLLLPSTKIDQGPISSTSLRRVFVLKTSYEVRTLKIGFHQTIELCELLTFCHIFKTHI